MSSQSNCFVTVTDSLGCSITSETFNISEPPAIVVNVTPSSAQTCVLGDIQLNASSPSSITSWNWTPSNSGLSCYNCTSPIAQPATTVNYTATATDSIGCTAFSIAAITSDHTCCGEYLLDFTDSLGGISNQNLNLNTSFTLAGDLTIQDCSLSIAEGVEITVPANFTLTIENSDLHACGEPWKGITLSDPTAKVFVLNGSTIRDAIVGIHASNDASVEIYNSTFSDNGTGILLQNGSFSNFIVDGASFSGTSYFTPRFGISLDHATNL
jgi:hypothetical protein